MLTRTGLGVAVGAILVGALGVRFGYIELIAGAVCAFGLLIVSWLAANRSTKATVIRESLPQRAIRGEIVVSRLRVINGGRTSVPPLALVDELDGRAVETTFEALAPGEEIIISAELPATRRGICHVGPIRLRRTDPFGLVAVERIHGSVQELVVHPRVHVLSGPRGVGRFSEADFARRTAASDPLSGFQSMREYVPGDDTRIIHWPTTAKTGRLMVREFVDPRRPTYTVILLTDVGDYHDDDFEEAVDAAASLASHVLTQEVDVVLRTTDPHHAGPSTPVRDERQMLDLLARVQMTDTMSTVPIPRLLLNARGRSTVVAIGGSRGSGLGDLAGPVGDLRSVRIGTPTGTSTHRVLCAADAAAFALHWSELAT